MNYPNVCIQIHTLDLFSNFSSIIKHKFKKALIVLSNKMEIQNLFGVPKNNNDEVVRC